jgi:putative membrane-bound dehydrogenase-like protein
MFSLRHLALGLALFGFTTRLSADAPAPLQDAAKRMTLPPGFHATLFAGEPDVVQPIAMTFDDRGRLWVVECRSYPKWRSDGTGHDRVVILEDADGDGRFDKRTVFLDNGSNLSSIELGFGGVWLCSLPNLIFVPDRDGDDKPDGPPEVLLDGWNLKDTKHNVFNSLAWGPDGWLYGCNGIQARSKVGKPGTPEKDRVYLDCGVWRYHPTRKVFEAYAWGTTNPFGLDWDDYGQMFITNCVIDHIWHVVPGSHMQRMYGQDANPYTFDLMRSCADHRHWIGSHWTESRGNTPQQNDYGGGHAHSGCCVYLGDNFPAEYRNSAFMCNIHGQRVNRDTLRRNEAGYVAKHAKDFLFANDMWFRGICVKQGPDGELYVSDWSDTGECHNYITVDASNGRIYKVVFGTPKHWTGDLSKLSDADLVKLQLHKNDWFVRHARRLLQERAAAGKLSADVQTQLRAIRDQNLDTTRKLRAFWAGYAIGKFDASDYRVMLDSPDDAIRTWGITLLAESDQPRDAVVSQLEALARRADRSPRVRLILAAAMRKLPDTGKLTLARALFTRPEDNANHNLALMDWYGIQPAVLTHPAEALALVNMIAIERVREYIPRCVLAAASDPAEALRQVAAALASAHSDAVRRDLLRGIRDALAGRKGSKPPAEWAALYRQLTAAKSAEVRGLADDVGLLLGDPGAIAAVKARMTDKGAPAAVRVAAIDRLAGQKIAGLAPALRDLLADPAVRGAALRGLAAYPDAATPAAILRAYPSFTSAEQADAVQTLAARPAFAHALLNAVAAGTVPKNAITAFTARQIQSLNDKSVREQLAKVWGTVRPASATRQAQAAKYKQLLTSDSLKGANAAHGRAIFTRNCAACHKLFGEGGDVGPELTGSQRAKLDYVLENVLDPSAVVPSEYRMTTFILLDGRVITGIVRKETPQAVTVRTVNEEVTIPVADIDARKPTKLSVMPDGLFDVLKDEEVRDLVAYLASTRQVPLPPDVKR